MPRVRKRFRTAQVFLLTVSAIMVAAMMVTVVLSPGIGDDYGVVWQEPASITLDDVRADEGDGSFVLTFHLWDAENRVTEWNGRMGLQVADENNDMVLDTMIDVGSRDFTTVRVDGVVDTYLVLSVPFEELDHVSERMLAHPSYVLGVRATFTFGRTTLTMESGWWTAPTYVKVEAFYIDDKEGWVLYDVYLFDDDWRTTKWSGDLRIIIHDSTGFDMYNGTVPIEAWEFNTLSWGDSGYAWYRGWVFFDEIRRSSDRLEGGGDDGTGRWMRMLAWFSYDGVTVRQDAGGPTARVNTQAIPDALLVENTPPVVKVTTEWWGVTGWEHAFDASGTRDDLGTEGLVFEWSWGDGTLEEVTDEPNASHVFARAGSFIVQLRVVDVEGACTTVTVDVEVIQDPRVDPDRVGEGELLDQVLDSYALTKLKDAYTSQPRDDRAVVDPSDGR